jgi:hypothetical protein
MTPLHLLLTVVGAQVRDYLCLMNDDLPSEAHFIDVNIGVS